jgi:hypothetical protein
MGADWYCFRLANIYTGVGPSICHRTEDQCSQHRDSVTPGPTDELSGCAHQAKAAVVTYFDVMHDRWNSWASATSDECARVRRTLAQSQDNKQISSCQLVGVVNPPPAPFKSAVVPPGEEWFCTTDGDRLCSRSPCVDGESCARQVKASAFTSSESGTPNAWAYRAPADCERVRQANLFSADEVSACTLVGATTIAAPPGNGWYCYRVGDNANEGSCHREADACDRMRNFDERNRQLNPGPCVKAVEAFGFVREGAYVMVGSEAMCNTRMTGEGFHGRCARIR